MSHVLLYSCAISEKKTTADSDQRCDAHPDDMSLDDLFHLSFGALALVSDHVTMHGFRARWEEQWCYIFDWSTPWIRLFLVKAK